MKTPTGRGNMIKNENELLLADILNNVYPGKWIIFYKGIDGRKYEFDCASPEFKVAVEIDGGMYPFYAIVRGKRVKVMKSGHSSPEGIMRDMEKSNAAQIEGWRILRYTPDQLRKTPWRLIADVRKLCGASNDAQQTLCLDGCKSASLEQVQVKISDDSGMRRFSHGH